MAIIDYNNGTATISINGGQAPFSYLLLQNGTAVTHSGVNFQNPIVSSNNSVVFGDASDLTGSYGIPSGTYTCQITDDLGCVVTTSEIVVGQTQEATTTTLATTPATTLLQEYISLTVDQSPVNEGLNVLFTLTSSNIPNNTMVDWSISGSIDSNDISGGLAGTFTIVNNQAQYLATIETDNLLEGQEELTLTLAAIDTNGISAGLSVDVIINDMNTAATTLATNATTLATNATTLATDATTLATDATTLATDATTLATTTLPTFTCGDANFTVNTGVVGTGVSATSTGVPTLIVPAHYVLGVNSYTATITVPATDAWGTAYSNAGGSIECSAVGVGIVATTLATTAAPLKGYYLHGGNQAYPFAQGEGLTANPTGTLYYDNGTNAYADTTDLSVAMTYLMNLGTITGAGGYTIQEFDIAAGGITSMGTSDALQFPASTQAEFYYVILPDTEVDLTSVSPQHLVNGGIETNAIQKMPFTWNGTGYYIYKIGGGSQSGALTITFSDND